MNGFGIKRNCEEEQLQTTGSFEEDTFRHMLAEKRIIILNKPITDNAIERIVIPIIGMNEMDDEAEEQVVGYDRRSNPIKIFINTGGGHVEETLSCISAIESSKTPVYTYALGKALSGGFFILLAGHARFCQKYSTLMYHQIQTGIPYSDMTSNKEHVEETIRLQAIINEFLLRKTTIRQKKIQEINDKKIDWYLGAEDALKYKMIDSICY